MPPSQELPPGYHWVRKRRQRRKPRRRIAPLIALLILAVVVAAAWSALPAYAAMRDARTQLGAIQDARDTVLHAPSAAGLSALDGHIVRLRDDLRAIQGTWGFWGGPALLASRAVPHIHDQLEQVGPLLEYSASVTQAGHLVSAGLAPVLRTQLDRLPAARVPALTGQLAGARPALHQAVTLLAAAARARSHIQPEHLPSIVQDGLHTLDPLLPPARGALSALSALPAALGADGPRHYLVVPQNVQDLRATGGFIGTVGELRVDHGRAQLMHMQDAYAVDRGHRPNADPPVPLGVHGATAWYFRDANWSADFPTSAQLLQVFYRLGTRRHVDGVIAFDSYLLPQLVNVTGPVSVPGYRQTLTPGNAFNTIDYYTNVRGTPNKAFAVAAYKATFARLLDVLGTHDAPMLDVVRDGVRMHHLLLYASDPAVEHAIRLAGADGAIDPTRGDYLYVVDTNTSRDKVNQLVDETVDYHAAVQPDRSILATAVIHYSNNADVHNINTLQGGQPTYSDFVRVLAPAGSTLLSRDGLDEPWVTLPMHDKTQFAGWFTLPSHASRTVTFRYRIPANADPGGQYTLLVQKQPGTGAIPLRIDVSGAARITLGSSTHLSTALDGDVALTAPLSGGTPRLQRLHLGLAEPLVTPGSHPEPWVTVPTRSVAAY